MIHPRAPKQVYSAGADLADEDADPKLVALLQDLGGCPCGLESPPAGLLWPFFVLQKRGQGTHGPGEVEHCLG